MPDPQDQTFTDVTPIPQTFTNVNSIADTLAKASSISAQPKPFTKEWFKQGLWRAGVATAEAMPAVGATVGGMIGSTEGPAGTVGGAGVGGMGGEAAKQLMERGLGLPAPATPEEAAKRIATAGVVQGGVQTAAELMPPLAGPLKGAAETQYERALAPTTRVNKAIAQKITPELIQRGEYGSLQGLNETAAKNVAEVKPQLDVAYGQTPAAATQGSGTQIVQDLEDLKGKYIVNGQPANPQAIKAIEGVQDIVRQQGADIDPDALRKLKSIFDDPVAQRGGYAGADLATAHTLQAQKVAANSIRNIMSQANPDVAALNKEISFWLNVQRVTGATIERRAGQAGGLNKVFGPMAGGAAGAVGTTIGGAHAGIEAALISGFATTAYQVMRSSAWRTASAVAKDAFADALARGDVGTVSALAARFGVAAPGAAQLSRQATPTQ